MKITPTQKVINEGNTYKSKEILSNLSPSDYQVRVRAKNSHGWSPYKEEKIFIRGIVLFLTCEN